MNPCHASSLHAELADEGDPVAWMADHLTQPGEPLESLGTEAWLTHVCEVAAEIDPVSKP